MSPLAKAIAVVLLLLLGFAYWLIRRNRRRPQ
jgi:membrane-anchored protein YejM (alkaline phosphatase superfamily)